MIWTWETFIIVFLLILLIGALLRMYFAEQKVIRIRRKISENSQRIARLEKEKEEAERDNRFCELRNKELNQKLQNDEELIIYQKEQIKLLQQKIETIKEQYQSQLQFGQINSTLSETMYKNLDLPLKDWIANVLSVLINTLPISQMSFYLLEEDKLRFFYGYGIKKGKDFALGEGFVGQAALTGLPVTQKIQNEHLLLGEIKIQVPFLVFVPLIFNEEKLGVIEYYLLNVPNEENLQKQLALWQKISEGLAAYLRNQDIAELLQKTQEQNFLLKQHEEELKKHIQALQEAQNSLQKMNETLEERVKERTRELEQTLEELKTTQQQLLTAEREAVLGKLVSNIAHEVNTPFGAIKASAEDIETSLPLLNTQYAKLFNNLAEKEQLLLQNILSEILKIPALRMSAKEERHLKKKYKRILQKNKVERAHSIAQKFILAGIEIDIFPYLDLFKHSLAEEITDIIYAFGRLRTDSQTIKVSIEKVKKIIYALKFYTQKARGDQVHIDLKASIQKVLETYQNYLKNTEVKIYFPKHPVLIKGVRDEIDLIWQNILFNSIQALAPQTRKEISIRLEDLDTFVRVRLTDNGPGIPPEIQQRIFEPFVTTKTGGEGTGLGLNIVHKIVSNHNGNIRFKSVEGRTEFIIELPKNPQE